MKPFVPSMLAMALVAAPLAVPAMAADLSSLQLSNSASQTYALSPDQKPFQLSAMITSASSRRAEAGAKMPWLSAVLNFFFMGAGYIYNGDRVPLGTGLTLASLGLDYVEMGVLQPRAFAAGATSTDLVPWAVMFGSVFLANTFLAIDAYQEAEQINAR